MRSTHCTLHIPGHSAHYLQARQITDFARNFPDRCRPAVLTDLGAGWFTAGIADVGDGATGDDSSTRTGWNHDPDLVTDIARDSVLGEVWYVPDFAALVRWTAAGQRAGTVLVPAWDEPAACLPAQRPVAVGGGLR
ncbi:MAG: hypothetical protein L0K27_06430 [Corynebacterium nuruki]|nr:hypothetical protein [Corynebacterium nuruki]